MNNLSLYCASIVATLFVKETVVKLSIFITICLSVALGFSSVILIPDISFVFFFFAVQDQAENCNM